MVWAPFSINGRTRSEYGTQMVLNFFRGLPNLKNDQYSNSLVFLFFVLFHIVLGLCKNQLIISNISLQSLLKIVSRQKTSFIPASNRADSMELYPTNIVFSTLS